MRLQHRKHSKIDWMLERPSESQDDGRIAGYFPRELRSLLCTLDYHAKPIYIGKKTPTTQQGLQVGGVCGPI
jgi:hypothetical protein